MEKAVPQVSQDFPFGQCSMFYSLSLSSTVGNIHCQQYSDSFPNIINYCTCPSHICLYSSCSHYPESLVRHFCQLTIKSVEIMVRKKLPGGERQLWNKMREVSTSWWNRDLWGQLRMYWFSISSLWAVQAGFFSAAGAVLQDLQGAGGVKAVKLQPFCPCDESSAVYSQLTAVKFIKELQISIATATVEICQTISPLRMIVTISKANSETSIICSRSFVHLGKEKYQEMLFSLASYKATHVWLSYKKLRASVSCQWFYGVVAVQIETFPVPSLHFASCFLGDFASKISEVLRTYTNAVTYAFSCNVVDEVAAY